MQRISSAAMERGCFCSPSHFRTYFEYTTRYGSLLSIEDMQKGKVFTFGTLLFSMTSVPVHYEDQAAEKEGVCVCVCVCVSLYPVSLSYLH